MDIIVMTSTRHGLDGHLSDGAQAHQPGRAVTQTRRRLLLVCEAVAGFKAVPQMLRDIDPTLRIHEIAPSQDKFLRAQPLAAAWNDDRVLVPENAPWVDEYLTEFEAFTGVDDDEDDQVDATAHLFNALYRPAPARTPGVKAATGPFG
jgi:predicted phage terminase large subunit-like protein